MTDYFLSNLKRNLKKPLPGIEAHKKMMPEGRIYETPKSNYIKASVNIILFPKNNEISFLLTKRNSQMRHHSGQISLPGGKKDKTDADLWETAKRETFEETGIQIKNNNYIGKLTDLYIPVSDFLIQPYVSFIEKEPILPEKTNEVEKFYIVKIKDFFSDSNKSKKTLNRNNKPFTTPFYKLDDKIDIVWGATAMILSEFHQIIK